MGTTRRHWYWILLLLIAWINLKSNTVNGQDTITIKMDFTGGRSSCSIANCDDNEFEIFVPNFACNDGRGDWNNGYLYFQDPVPPGNGYVIWNFTATAYGRFDCNGTSDNALLGIMLVAGTTLSDQLLPTATGSCNCPNCAKGVYFESSEYQNGWPGYSYIPTGGSTTTAGGQSTTAGQSTSGTMTGSGSITGSTSGSNGSAFYGNQVNQQNVVNQQSGDSYYGSGFGGNNSFQFVAMMGFNTPTVCVSFVNLTFAYGPSHYAVSDLIPKRGPHSGGTTVTVLGENFSEAQAPSCSFSGKIVTGVMVNDSVILCVTPPATCDVYPCNVTVEVANQYQGYSFNRVNFTYFRDEDPNVKPPHSPPLLWVYVAVAVCAGSVILVIAAGYIYAKRNTSNSARFVDEQSRLINSERFKKYGSLHPIDISEIMISQRIGRGSCAEVYMGLWRGTTVAIKKAKVFADDDEEFFTELAQEAEIMSSLRHPNVLQFLGTASSPPELVIVMEFMSRGSLYRIIHDKSVELPWSRLRLMALDIARGMNYLHCSDPIVIHRDLKSHNLLVDEHFKVKVCDFGLSTMVKRHLDKFTAMTPVGTPCWTAPEVLRNEPYTERADVFSFGVVMWELVTREDPYHGMPTFQIVIAVGQHNMRPVVPASVSPSLSSLITQCWSEDPGQRPPFSEIVTRLEKM